MRDFDWAQNKQKLARAVGKFPNGTEEEIKEEYKKYLGVVLETTPVEPETISEPEVKEEPVEEVKKQSKKKK